MNITKIYSVIRIRRELEIITGTVLKNGRNYYQVFWEGYHFAQRIPKSIIEKLRTPADALKQFIKTHQKYLGYIKQKQQQVKLLDEHEFVRLSDEIEDIEYALSIAYGQLDIPIIKFTDVDY